MTPNFFLVGASRAGTTSLWDYLGQHPDVFFPALPFPKEPSHFCDLTPVWARKYRDPQAYLEGFRSAGDEKARGDASTTYLPSPEVPDRIRRLVPDAKIIISLRNPADRAFSLYSLLCQFGFEEITSFEQALETEEVRRESEDFKHNNRFWYYAYLYFHSGLYSEQVARYLDVFPPDRVKIVLFESIKRHPIETTQDIYRFLEVDPTFEARTKRRNKSFFPLSVSAQCLIARSWRNHPLKGSESPPTVIDHALLVGFLSNLLLGRLRRHVFRPETRRVLLQRYAEDIRRTSDLIGIDLRPWIQGEHVAIDRP